MGKNKFFFCFQTQLVTENFFALVIKEMGKRRRKINKPKKKKNTAKVKGSKRTTKRLVLVRAAEMWFMEMPTYSVIPEG